jgi:hypothetical protein
MRRRSEVSFDRSTSASAVPAPRCRCPCSHMLLFVSMPPHALPCAARLHRQHQQHSGFCQQQLNNWSASSPQAGPTRWPPCFASVRAGGCWPAAQHSNITAISAAFRTFSTIHCRLSSHNSAHHNCHHSKLTWQAWPLAAYSMRNRKPSSQDRQNSSSTSTACRSIASLHTPRSSHGCCPLLHSPVGIGIAARADRAHLSCGMK